MEQKIIADLLGKIGWCPEPLEGKNVNLRIVEREDLPKVAEWANDPETGGEHEPFEQTSLKELEKSYGNLRPDEKWFTIEKEGGKGIGQYLAPLWGLIFE